MTSSARTNPVKGPRGKIGIPFVLNMYELFPFWHTFFTSLGFEVIASPESTRELYTKGQYSIPSDTACYPAKLVHGHIEALLDEGIDTIFYPCMSYNFDEHRSDNHYNCPVVAYYPELIAANVTRLKKVHFLDPNIGLFRPHDFVKRAEKFLGERYGVTHEEVKTAAKAAYAEYDRYMKDVKAQGKAAIDFANKTGRNVSHTCRQTIPYRSRDKSWHRQADIFVRPRGRIRGLGGGSGERAESPCAESVDISFAHVRGRQVRYDPSERRIRSAGVVRLRSRRDNYRREPVYLRARRQTVHSDKDRRDKQSGRGQDKDPQPDSGYGIAQ
jgi:hypothetical protein